MSDEGTQFQERPGLTDTQTRGRPARQKGKRSWLRWGAWWGAGQTWAQGRQHTLSHRASQPGATVPEGTAVHAHPDENVKGHLERGIYGDPSACGLGAGAGPNGMKYPKKLDCVPRVNFTLSSC